MSVKFKLDLSKWDAEFFADALNRVESAADVIRNSAKVKLKASIASAAKGGNSLAGERWREHGPYKSGQNAGASWTKRYHQEMVDTIRTVRSLDPTKKDIWIIAGNYDSWWAKQLEYGNGGWKGGKKSFFRPAMRESMNEVVNICENGGGPRGAK